MRRSNLIIGAAAVLAAAGAVRARRLARLRPVRALYDDDCSLCSWFARSLKRADGGGRVEWVPAALLDGAPPGEMVAQMPDGSRRGGFEAVRTVCAVIPVLRPLAVLLCVPGAGLLGRPVYRLVARHRPRGCRTRRPAGDVAPPLPE